MKKAMFIFSILVVLSSSGQINAKRINKLRKKYYTREFYNGYAIIQHKRKRLLGLINQEGKIVIDPQYWFLKGVSKCESLLASNQLIYGPNDGGGKYIKGFKDIRLINPQNKLIKDLPDIRIIDVFGKDKTGDYKNIFNFIDSFGKMGLIDDCGRILVPAEYLHINRFNEKGQAVVFKNDSIQVINAKGEKLLPAPIQYKVNPVHFFTIPTPGEINYLSVINNKLIAQKNGLYGIIDIRKNITFTAFVYENISIRLLKHENDTIGYRVKKNDKETILDIKTGKEILPFVFNSISKIGVDGNKRYVSGWLKERETGRYSVSNIFDRKEGKLLFPRDFSFSKVYPMNNDNWIIYFISTRFPKQSQNNYSEYNGIYNTKSHQFILEPRVSNKFSLMKVNNRFAEFYDKKAKKAGIFDVKKQKTVVLFDHHPEITIIHGGDFYRLAFKITKLMPNGSVLTSYVYSYFTKDFQPIMENIKEKAFFHYENHKLFIYPDLYSQKLLRVYNTDGELIQEKLMK